MPIAVTATASTYMPAPAHMPIAVTSQSPAAVVRPWIVAPLRRMDPPARKPIPATTEAAMRELSTATRSSFE